MDVCLGSGGRTVADPNDMKRHKERKRKGNKTRFDGSNHDILAFSVPNQRSEWEATLPFVANDIYFFALAFRVLS